MKKKVFIIAGVACAVVLVVVCVLIMNSQKKKYSDLYTSLITLNLLTNKNTALIAKVWYNSIYHKYSSETDEFTTYEISGQRHRAFYNDFNYALKRLFESEDFQVNKRAIKHLSEKVATLFNDLSPRTKCYGVAEETYKASVAMVMLAVDPSGSLTTYSRAANGNSYTAENALQRMRACLKAEGAFQ